MLVSFALNNVKSFRKWEELSLISASKIQELSHHEINNGRLTILKNAGIFGANASGKSNLIKGLSIARDLIVTGRINERNVSFLDDKGKSTSFSFVFDIDDNLYSYGFTIKPSGILANYLIEDESIDILNKDGSVKTVLYSKSDKEYAGVTHPILKVFYNQYFVNAHLLFLTYMNTPEKIIMDNKTSSIMKRIFDFFMLDLIIVDSFSNNYAIINETNINNISAKLKEYDTGIETAVFEKDERQDFLKTIPQPIMSALLNNPNANRLSVANEDELVCISKGSGGTMNVQKLVIRHKNIQTPFSFHDESHGTKRLFYLIGILFGGQLKDKVFVIDEIEKGCHPNLIKQLITDFQNFNVNNNAQLIFTSHLSSLMEDVLRRDEVYFIEKNNLGISTIYSLLDYKDRTTSISKRYLEGRFGAVPNLKVSVDATDI